MKYMFANCNVYKLCQNAVVKHIFHKYVYVLCDEIFEFSLHSQTTQSFARHYYFTNYNCINGLCTNVFYFFDTFLFNLVLRFLRNKYQKFLMVSQLVIHHWTHFFHLRISMISVDNILHFIGYFWLCIQLIRSESWLNYNMVLPMFSQPTHCTSSSPKIPLTGWELFDTLHRTTFLSYYSPLFMSYVTFLLPL